MPLPPLPSTAPGAADPACSHLVLAWDAPDVGARLLAMAEAHWSYTDRFHDTLLFRGPLLSDDGQRHAGSLHLLGSADAAFAQRFAQDEPYHRAGLFERVEVLRFQPLQPPAPRAQDLPDAASPHAFVRARWPARPGAEVRARATPRLHGPQWLLLGLLVDGADRCTGLAGVLNGGFATARAALGDGLSAAGLPAASIEAVRWRRGGRG